MSYAVHSIEYILYREGNLIALRTFLELLQSSLGLTIYESSSSEDLAALAFTCNLLVYILFWYACIAITRYARSRQNPYDRENTLVPPIAR